MTNFEKYQKELAEIAVKASEFGLKNGKPVRCTSIACRECNWEKGQCFHSAKEWVNQEYEEPKIQPEVKDLKTDDKVLVSIDGKDWHRRYFSYYDPVENNVYAFTNGGTSWSVEEILAWDYAKLPENL